MKTEKALLLALLAASACAWGQPADVRGIYIYTNDVSQISKATAAALTTSFGLSGVDGVAVVAGWDSIEPAMGQYDWTLLDQWVGQVAALGKKIDLVIPAGSATPAWLFQAGAKPLNFTISPHSGATGLCQPVTLAAPWDPLFLSQWDAMLAALAAHLKSAGTYGAVTLVRLTGINRTTEELRLPAETAASTGLACVSDAPATWQQAGYRPSLLLNGWNAILASFAKSFPDKVFAVSIIPNNGFPPIGEDGALIKGTPPDATQPMITAANQKLPGRLVVQFDFLMPGEAASPEVVQAAQNLGTMAAFQTNEYFGQTGQGAACGEPVTNPKPCDAASFLALLETGIYPAGKTNPLRAQYIEVFHANATAFPDDLLQAHFELQPPAISLVANAEGEAPLVAPNTWVEIKGAGLALTGHTRTWQSADFAGGKMPAALDGVSVTVNGKAAFVYYISPAQVNVLTPPDAMSGPVQVAVTNNGQVSANFTAQAAALAPSLFVFGGGPYVAATHATGALIGPATLYPGATTAAKPGETVVLYANGFGPVNTAVVSGSITQSGTLTDLPVVTVGGAQATVQFAGLVSPGEFQFNVVLPVGLADGDQPISVSYGGAKTQPGTLIAVAR